MGEQGMDMADKVEIAGEAERFLSYAEAEYEFEIWQDDFVQASGSAPTVEEAMTEAGHYALMYAQDGPVAVRYYERRQFMPIGYPASLAGASQ